MREPTSRLVSGLLAREEKRVRQLMALIVLSGQQTSRLTDQQASQ